MADAAITPIGRPYRQIRREPRCSKLDESMLMIYLSISRSVLGREDTPCIELVDIELADVRALWHDVAARSSGEHQYADESDESNAHGAPLVPVGR
jgi:hypothetical protein